MEVIERNDVPGLMIYEKVYGYHQAEKIYHHFENLGWEKRRQNEVHYYGFRQDASVLVSRQQKQSLFLAEELSPFLECVSNMLVENEMMSDNPNMVAVVKYEPDQESQPLLYQSMFGPEVAMLIVGSFIDMSFTKKKRQLVPIKNGSIVTLSGAARFQYSHSFTSNPNRGTCIVILFLRNSISGKPYSKSVSLEKSVTKRSRPSTAVDIEERSSNIPKHQKGDCIARSKQKPYAQQLEVINYMNKHRGLIAAMGTGSGKTLVAVISSQCFLNNNPNGRVIVITPSSLRQNFKDVIDESYGGDSSDPRYCFFGSEEFPDRYDPATDTITLPSRDDSGICTKCENVYLIIDEAHVLRTPTKWAKKEPPPPKMKAFGGMYVISDPDQLTKVPGKRAEALINCAKKAAKVLLLTATPLYNNPYDIANLVAMIKGTEPLSLKEFQYAAEFKHRPPKGVKSAAKKVTDVTRYLNFDYFKCCFYFYTPDKKKDKRFPKEVERWEFIEMTPNFYKKYFEVQKQQLALFEEDIKLRKTKKGVVQEISGLPDPTVFLTKVAQATNVIEPQQKVNRVMEIVLNRKPREKIMIYTGFLSAGIDVLKAEMNKRFENMTLSQLKNEVEKRRAKVTIKPGMSREDQRRQYEEALYDYVDLSGKTTPAERARKVKIFNDPDSGVDVIIVSKVGESGLDLKGTRKVIMLESMWNRPNEMQVLGRAARVNSHAHLPSEERKVEVIHLILTKPGGPKREEPFEGKTGEDLSPYYDLYQTHGKYLPKFRGKRDMEEDNMDSADVIKMKLTLLKAKKNEDFEQRLKEVSINKIKC